MKIGASTLAGIESELDNILEFIETIGLDYAEIVHQYPHDKIDTEILESYNLKYSVHAPFMDVNIAAVQEKSRLNSIEQIKESINLANEINCEAVVVHPGLATFLANKYFIDNVYKFANESIEEIGKYARDLGVLTTVENTPSFDGMLYNNISDLNELLLSLDMYMTLDVGHANHAGYTPDEMIFDSIKHIHMHDNYGDDDEHLAFGEGNIDLKSIINNFNRKNYDGIYIIEVNDTDSIKKSYEYIKKIF